MKKTIMTFALAALATGFSTSAMAIDEAWYNNHQVGGASSSTPGTVLFSAGGSFGGSMAGNASVSGSTGHMIGGVANQSGYIQAESMTNGLAQANSNAIYVESTSAVGLSSNGFECAGLCNPWGGVSSSGASNATAGNGINGSATSGGSATFH